MAKRGPVTPKGSVAELSAFLDLHGAGGRGRRSSLSRWMRANHDEFAAMLATKEPGWNKVAAWLGTTAGLLDGSGRPPTGERVRKVWWETRRDKSAAEATSQGRSSSRVAGKIVHPVHVTQEADLAGDRAPPGSEMLSEAHPATQPPPMTPVGSGIADRALVPGQAAPAGDVDEELRRARELLGRGTVPIPGSVR